MADKVIITCAVTGNLTRPEQHPNLPITPAEIATAALDAARAGAAIAHIHVRDPRTGEPSMALEHYREVVERIRASETDLIINLTTGPGGRFVPSDDDPKVAAPGTTLVRPERRVEHVLALKPEVCSLDLNTMWFGSAVVINTPRNAKIMAEAIRGAGVLPELEVFDSGDLQLAHQLLADGVLARPPLFQIVLGIRNGFPATPETLLYAKSLLPADGHRPHGVPDRGPGLSARRSRARRSRGQSLPQQRGIGAVECRAGRAGGAAGRAARPERRHARRGARVARAQAALASVGRGARALGCSDAVGRRPSAVSR
jgi:uncharacterized protein (DUF849 family)